MYEWERDEALIRRYHLGDVSRAEYARVVICAWLSWSYKEGVGVVEDELVDDFVLGCLAGRELALFTCHFMRRPGGAWKVRFARALFAYVGSHAPAASSGVSVVRRAWRRGRAERRAWRRRPRRVRRGR